MNDREPRADGPEGRDPAPSGSGRHEIPTTDPGDYGKPDSRGVLEKVRDALSGGEDREFMDDALDRKV